MGGIDPKTVLLMTGTLGGVMALVLYLLRRSYLPAVMGIGFWALSLAMTFVAGTLFSTTGTLPVPVSTTLPSMMLYLSPYVSLLGTQRFFGATSKHLSGAVQALRFVSTLIYPAGLNAMDASPQNVAYLVTFSFTIVLISISHVLLVNMLGRYGGEEFVVLLPETPLDVAQLVAERVRAAMAGQPGPTVSIGVTTSLGAGDSVDALLARADAAMYRAKALGRNRVESV